MAVNSDAADNEIKRSFVIERLTQFYDVVFFGSSGNCQRFFHSSNSSKLLKRKTPLGLTGLPSKSWDLRCNRVKRSQTERRFSSPTILIDCPRFCRAIRFASRRGTLRCSLSFRFVRARLPFAQWETVDSARVACHRHC